MDCRSPYALTAGLAVRCLRCLPCRLHNQSVWANRMLLESLAHDANAFVTLTYNDEHNDGSVHRAHWIEFRDKMKAKLRYRKMPMFRYYAVGEYGKKSGRPHYHYSQFGYDSSLRELIEECWPYGFIHIHEFNHTTARYVAKYNLKMLSLTGDPKYRLPEEAEEEEFSTMSKHPAIGVPSLQAIVSAIAGNGGGSVPLSFRLNGKHHPFGRTLRKHLYELMGIDPKDDIQRWIDDTQAILLPMLEAEIMEDPKSTKTTSQLAEEIGRNRRESKVNRFKIFNEGKEKL
jgi:hypothetical protein